AVQFLAVEGADGGPRCAVIRHGYERKAAGPTGLAVGDDRDFFDSAVRGKCLAERVLTGGETEIPCVDLHGSQTSERRGSRSSRGCVLVIRDGTWRCDGRAAIPAS